MFTPKHACGDQRSTSGIRSLSAVWVPEPEHTGHQARLKLPRPLSQLVGTAFVFKTLLLKYLVHKTFLKLMHDTLYHARASADRKPSAKHGQCYHLALLEGRFWFCSQSQPPPSSFSSGHSPFPLSPRALLF